MDDNELARRLREVIRKGTEAQELRNAAERELDQVEDALIGRRIETDCGGGKGTYEIKGARLSYDGDTFTLVGRKVTTRGLGNKLWEIRYVRMHTLGLDRRDA